MNRQEVVFYPFELKLFSGPSPAIEVAKKPDWLWTLVHERDEKRKPKLPIVPVHGHNAFLEDVVHDWNWRDGKLRYYSRISSGGIWLLLEYGDE